MSAIRSSMPVHGPLKGFFLGGHESVGTVGQALKGPVKEFGDSVGQGEGPHITLWPCPHRTDAKPFHVSGQVPLRYVVLAFRTPRE